MPPSSDSLIPEPLLQDPSGAGARLPALRARFLSDFAGGAIGRHHNTYQHRLRVLRQLGNAARPAARASDRG